MTISIKTDENGRIVNRYLGEKGGEWIQTDESDWPETDPADNEIPRFFYDGGVITVEYKILEEDGFNE